MRRNHGDALAIVVELRDRGLDPVVLKGVGVQRLLYPDDVRLSSDVDLLVAPGEQRRAARALRDLGFATFARTGHATSWAARTRTPVDLHRTLPFCGVGARAVWRALAPHRTIVSIDDGDVTVLDAPATAVHLTIHLTQGVTDRTLDDLGRAVARISLDDWRTALGIARSLGTTRSMAWALGQVGGGEAIRDALGLPPTTRGQVPPSKPSEGGIARFATSSVHWRERLATVGPAARRVTSARSLAVWATVHGRPVPTTLPARLSTLAARARHEIGRRPTR